MKHRLEMTCKRASKKSTEHSLYATRKPLINAIREKKKPTLNKRLEHCTYSIHHRVKKKNSTPCGTIVPHRALTPKFSELKSIKR